MKHQRYTKKDFAWARWTPVQIQKAATEALAGMKEGYRAVKQLKEGEHTFTTTVEALEHASAHASDVMGTLHLLANVSPRAAVRDAAKKASEQMEKVMLGITQDAKIFAALKAINVRKEKLNAVQKKLLQDYLRAYHRMGLDLPPKKQKILRKNQRRLTTISSAFQHNINAYHDEILLTKEECTGLPESFIAQLPQKKGKRVVTLAYPHLFPFMEYAKNEAKRRELSTKFLRQGGPKNMRLLAEALRLRAENAKLLGYATHADYVTETRMAKSGQKALTFVERLLTKAAQGARDELAGLQELKRAETGRKQAKLQPWDIAYYSRQDKEHRYGIDNEVIRGYFPLEHVKQSVLEIYQHLLGVRFRKMTSAPLWHKDIELYAIHDKDGTLRSYFLMDLHPRPHKYGHAAAFDIITGRRSVHDPDVYVSPMACLVTNFPQSTKKQPSLLSHNEVLTFFHEFGHVMHHTLSEALYPSQSGFHVAWDFVEAPSQMLEYWTWDEKVLRKLSSHHETGQKLPLAMARNLVASRDHLLGHFVTRQCILAHFDILLHTQRVAHPEKLYARLVKQHLGLTLPKEQLFPAGFGHLMGYDAGYYSYMWAKVYAADMFSRFAREGVLSAKVGKAYREEILAKGSSIPEEQLVQNFLGRKPNNKAFLKEMGV